MSFPSPAAFPPSVPGVANNALVPTNAPIQPPQAFVDTFGKIASNDVTYYFDFSNCGITSITGNNDGDPAGFVDYLENGINFYHSVDIPHVDFSGNALNQGSIDVILYRLSQDNLSDQVLLGSLNLSGGTNSSPTTGAVSVAAWSLATVGWQIKMNLHGLVVALNWVSGIYNFSGNAMTVSEVNTLLHFLATTTLNTAASINVDLLTLAASLNLFGGTSAAPTGQGITDKATLIAAGWTVTTN